MGQITVAFLGDIFGSPGRTVVQQQLPNLRRDHRPHVIIANAENARSGSGLSPELYRKIRAYGIDAVTLGDHVFREKDILAVLQSPDEPICRPANLSMKAPGRSLIKLAPPASSTSPNLPTGRSRNVYVMTVLGRIFMSLPADDPFAAVDRVLSQLPEKNPIVVVEVHMEATSEKAALAAYLDGRVSLVVGTHTHVPTADARILPKGTGFITDVGMCGPMHSIIGRDPETVLRHMTTSLHTPYGMGSGGEAMCGVVVQIDESSARVNRIERVQYELHQA